ncbi:MAG: DUF58 domain-containing protein [Spirochaetales bacterium]|nr:DUF58 domain-containing protein [Spirochaetales bacterium]
MIAIDSQCEAVSRLFSKKSIRAKYPVYVKSENPIFKKKGTSYDLKNLREYQPSDDFRQIDWKLYGRTDRLYIKEFFEEENERFFLLVDTSASLNIFDLEYYKTFIASIAYIFLKLHFTINLLAFDYRVVDTCMNVKGHKNISRVLGFLERLAFRQKSDLVSVLKSVGNRYQPGTILLFSDLFDRNLHPQTLSLFRRCFVLHFHTAVEELDLPFAEIEIEDRELEKRLLLSHDPSSRRRMLRLEREFLSRFDRRVEGYHYYRIQKTADRVPFYWRLLESLYD